MLPLDRLKGIKCIIGCLSEFSSIAGLASPASELCFSFQHTKHPETRGDITTRKCAPWATAKFSESLSTDGKFGKVKLKNTDDKFRRKVFKGKCDMFKILKPSLLGKGIPMEESGWLPREPHNVTFCSLATCPGWQLRRKCSGAVE